MKSQLQKSILGGSNNGYNHVMRFYNFYDLFYGMGLPLLAERATKLGVCIFSYCGSMVL